MNKIITTTLLIAGLNSVHASELAGFEEHSIEIQKMLDANTKSMNSKGAGASYSTVGFTNDCDFRLGATKIQDALDFAEGNGIDEVRVAEGTYDETVDIDDFSVILQGGYTDCAAAETDTVNATSIATIINATVAGEPVIFISGNTQRNSITIANFTLTGAEPLGFSLGGGLSVSGADASVTLNQMSIRNNENFSGGGILVFGGDTDIAAFNLSVENNNAIAGGGIFCSGTDNSVLVNGAIDNFWGIKQNVSTGDGGGVYVGDGCRFTSYVGSNDTGAFGFDERGILQNTATNHGGGIFATGGGIVNLIGTQFCFFGCFGYDSEPVSVRFNTADSDGDDAGEGGGIYATGANTTVNVTNGYITHNSAYQGGGVTVADTANYSTNSTLQRSSIFGGPITDVVCWSPGSCNQLVRNRGDFRGGAVFAKTGGTAQINRTQFTANRANFGTAVYSLNADSNIEIEGALMYGNGDNGTGGYDDNNVIRVGTDARIELAWSTVADNNILDSDEIVDSGGGTIRLLSSIIHESNPVPVMATSTPASQLFDCMLLHEDASLEGNGFAINVDDPSFVDRANGDYHIDFNASPAMDYCDSLNAPAFTDSDNDQRGWDWSGINNIQGPYDVGYDEQNDLIFANGFEEIL
ncbi:hypothetical protein MNBD_GAMMA02-954 [hydrothermal vent metagenome]|uniref:Uncharacterized protein n=1 Tax=hydrothermal vent metagenome TaxID=652676 RepID=A0A3B0WQP6_9ZZZZ